MSAEMQNLIITVVIIPLITVLTKFIITWIQAKTAELQERTSNAKLKKYIGIADDAISSAVAAVSQTYVDALKKDSAFTAEKQAEAFKIAKEKAFAIIGNETLTALKKELNSDDFNAWIDTKIEEYVRIAKLLK